MAVEVAQEELAHGHRASPVHVVHRPLQVLGRQSSHERLHLIPHAASVARDLLDRGQRKTGGLFVGEQHAGNMKNYHLVRKLIS